MTSDLKNKNDLRCNSNLESQQYKNYQRGLVWRTPLECQWTPKCTVFRFFCVPRPVDPFEPLSVNVFATFYNTSCFINWMYVTHCYVFSELSLSVHTILLKLKFLYFSLRRESRTFVGWKKQFCWSIVLISVQKPLHCRYLSTEFMKWSLL